MPIHNPRCLLMLFLQAFHFGEFQPTLKLVAVPFSVYNLSSNVVITLNHNPPLLDCPEDFGHCFIPSESILCCTCFPELLYSKIYMVFFTSAVYLEMISRQCCLLAAPPYNAVTQTCSEAISAEMYSFGG